MRDLPDRPAADLSGDHHTTRAAYARLLAEDERAAAAGSPILTGAGRALLQRLARGTPARPPGTPHWDADARRLWLGSQFLKEYRQPAARQMAVLTAFEAIGWAGHIADPLPPEPGEDLVRRRQRL
jgi:hypothetical protein